MTPVVPPLPFPGSRTVAAWWREFEPRRPTRLWLCHLLLHRVEALAEIHHTSPLSTLRREVLRSLALGHPPEGLDPAVRARLERDLTALGLVTRTESGFRPTDAGRHALASGCLAAAALERRSFCFLDNRTIGQPPHFLPVRHGTAVSPAEPWEFDPGLLQAATTRDAAWKERFGFPPDVAAVRLPVPDDLDWRTVVFDRAEHLLVAFIEVATDRADRRLLGFAVKTNGWTVDAAEPAVQLTEGWEEALPDLAADPPESEWRAAWVAWGQQRGLPPVDLAACRLRRAGHQLRVEAPRRLVARLRETRSDALKGDTWLLAGSGRTQAAARVEIAEQDR